MPKTRDAFCSYCGTAFPPPLKYPRTCVNTDCAATIWANPIPVSVVLQPVRHASKVGSIVIVFIPTQQHASAGSVPDEGPN